MTSSAGMSSGRARHWRTALIVAVAAGSFSLLGLVAGSTLTDSAAALADVDWPWLALALVAEASSMAAFARTQRRLLRAGGTPVHLSSVMAVTYAGNAISVSLPLAALLLDRVLLPREDAPSRRRVPPT